MYLIDYTQSLFPWGVIYHTVTKFLSKFLFFSQKTCSQVLNRTINS